MSKILFTLVRALLLASLTVNLVWAEAPRAVMLEDVFDFGIVNEGTVISHEFEIRNEGDADLRIERVVAGCRCTAVNVPNEAILPAESDKILVELKTLGFSGNFEKQVMVYTNEVERAAVPFIIKGHIVPQISIEPAYINWGNVVFGENNDIRQKVQMEAQAGVELGKVVSFSKQLKIEKIEGDTHKKSFEIVLVNEELHLGTLRDRIFVEVKAKGRTNINVPVFVEVQNPLVVTPSALTIYDDFHEPIIKKLNLKNVGSKSIKINKVNSNVSFIDVVMKKIEKDEFELLLTIDASSVKREFKSVLTVETDSEIQPELVIDIHGKRKK